MSTTVSTASTTFSELKPGPDDLADRGVLVGRAAERDLVGLFPCPLEAENADVADVMMAAGVDAAGDLDLQRADLRARAPSPKRSEMRCAIGIERAVASAQ